MVTKNRGQLGIAESIDKRPEKVRYGAEDGPRKKRWKSYDGCEPLEFHGHEILAQHLATPKALRVFKSDTDLAKHFKVTRMTVHRWKRDFDVNQRAHWLSTQNEMTGDLVARREWPRIMEAIVKMAIMGDVAAAKFCESRAWRKEPQLEKTQFTHSVCIADLLGKDQSEEAEELKNDDRQSEGDDR